MMPQTTDREVFMQVQWTFEGCAGPPKEKCRAYWEKKQERLGRLLATIPSSSKTLMLAVYHQAGSIEKFEIRGVLQLPGRTLAVQFSHQLLFAALDGLADKLVNVSLKYKQRSAQFVRRQRRQKISDDLVAVQPLLAWDKKADRKESFFRTIRPLLGFLERQARNEIKIHELEGALSPEQVEPADVVNEVVVLAWEKFDQKKKDQPLDLWLFHLLHEILGRAAQNGQFVSLDQRFPLADIVSTAEPDWFEEVLGYQEELSLAELLPDYDQTDSWEQLDDLDRSLHFQSVLQTLSSSQRQAYLLHTMDDYSLKEVAGIQDRDVEEVDNDIRESNEAIGNYMQNADFIYRRNPGRTSSE
jgi:DNA-directed RNA polymerase specialized sigma24 family protein/ribosome-associated translation inhibitor RaiA